ncbi:tubulin-dependent ATPase kip3 [Mycoemilia scoparia]|uniref:Kinesin-like protein KIN-8B n=1 Tax=Mycoemilia scoparia TaxID=417184 RepID=A0A9W8DVD1_9FUNG|nr:tubulin-dependent ATPase kip3 [Mycoemilia scoparia]
MDVEDSSSTGSSSTATLVGNGDSYTNDLNKENILTTAAPFVTKTVGNGPIRAVNANNSNAEMQTTAAGDINNAGSGFTQAAIMVAVRVRPFSQKELNMMPQYNKERLMPINATMLRNGEPEAPQETRPHPRNIIRKIVHPIDDHVLVFDPPEEDEGGNMTSRHTPAASNKRNKDVRFVFDKVFGPDCEQREVYEGTTRSLLDSVMNGFNATVFAYGATGCGKTYTISGTPDDPGIIPLAMMELFERVKQANDEKVTDVSMSYLEVYNEMIRDLLVSGDKGSCPLALREDVKKGVTVAGLSEHKPQNVEDVMQLVLQGNERRTMSPTEANATSSRSHAVLQVHIRMKPRAGGLQSNVVTATLSIIDLAGSERGTVTKNRGERMREGANINRSLLALANCINALCDPKKHKHIPYRDSKLTRLLKFSLGGNCRTAMVTCVSPASTYYEETYNTLKYANRAKNIKTTVVKNTVNTKVHLAQYQRKIQEQSEEIKRLQVELASLRKRGPGSAAPAGIRSAGSAAPSAAEVRRQTQAIQIVQDIRNKLNQAYAGIDGSRWEHASSHMVSQWFEGHANALKGWREQFEVITQELQRQRSVSGESVDSSPNHSGAEAYRRSIDELLRELGRQCKTVERHAQHAQQTISRNKYTAERMAQIPPSARLSSEQKYQIEQEFRVLELASERRGLRRSVELSQHIMEEQANVSRKMFGLNAMCLAGLKTCLDKVSRLANDDEDVDPTALTKEVSSYLNMVYMQSITTFTEMTGLVSGAVKSVQKAGGPSKLPISGTDEEKALIQADTANGSSHAINGSSRPPIPSSSLTSSRSGTATLPPLSSSHSAASTSRPHISAAVAGTTRSRRLTSNYSATSNSTSSASSGNTATSASRRIRTTPRRNASSSILGRSSVRFASPRKRGAAGRMSSINSGVSSLSSTLSSSALTQSSRTSTKPPRPLANGIKLSTNANNFRVSSASSSTSTKNLESSKESVNGTDSDWVVMASPRRKNVTITETQASTQGSNDSPRSVVSNDMQGDEWASFSSQASSVASERSTASSIRHEPPAPTVKPLKGILKASNATSTPKKLKMAGLLNGPGPVRTGSARRRSRHARLSIAPTTRPAPLPSSRSGHSNERSRLSMSGPLPSNPGGVSFAPSTKLNSDSSTNNLTKSLAFKSLSSANGSADSGRKKIWR